MIDPKDPQSIANNPDAIRVLALEAKKDLGPLLQVVAQAVVLHDLDPMWLEYVARHYAEAHENIPAPMVVKKEKLKARSWGDEEQMPRAGGTTYSIRTDLFDADEMAERFNRWAYHSGTGGITR